VHKVAPTTYVISRVLTDAIRYGRDHDRRVAQLVRGVLLQETVAINCHDKKGADKFAGELRRNRGLSTSREPILAGLYRVGELARIKPKIGAPPPDLIATGDLHFSPLVSHGRRFTSTGSFRWDQPLIDTCGVDLARPGTVCRIDEGRHVEVEDLLEGLTPCQIRDLRG
jgi:hypothetical protein